MTAPVPGDTRNQLAERLQLAVHQAMDVHSGSHEMDECAAFTAALLPTVERIATERAAEALENVANSPGRDVRQRCLNLAAALRSKP